MVCHVLQLPAELRNRIYELALTNRKPANLEKQHKTQYGTAFEPALLLTCRQLRAEALTIFFGRNISYTWHHRTSITFLKRMAPEKLKMIKELRILGLPGGWPEAPTGKRVQLRSYECDLEELGVRIRKGVVRTFLVVENTFGKSCGSTWTNEPVEAARKAEER